MGKGQDKGLEKTWMALSIGEGPATYRGASNLGGEALRNMKSSTGRR